MSKAIPISFDAETMAKYPKYKNEEHWEFFIEKDGKLLKKCWWCRDIHPLTHYRKCDNGPMGVSVYCPSCEIQNNEMAVQRTKQAAVELLVANPDRFVVNKKHVLLVDLRPDISKVWDDTEAPLKDGYEPLPRKISKKPLYWTKKGQPNIVVAKTCPQCGRVKTSDGFSVRNDSNFGLKSWCKKCNNKNFNGRKSVRLRENNPILNPIQPTLNFDKSLGGFPVSIVVNGKTYSGTLRTEG